MNEITTSTGVTISIEEYFGSNFVILRSPDYNVETQAGRVIEGRFQPSPYAAYALSPEALRGIADLIESVSE